MRCSDWSSDVCSSDLHLVQRIAVIILGNGFDPLWLVAAQVVQRHGGTAFATKGGDLFGQFAFVEVSAMALRDALQGIGRALQTEHFTRARRAAVGHDGRSEERRVGTACGRTCSTRWSPCPKKKNKKTANT